MTIWEGLYWKVDIRHMGYMHTHIERGSAFKENMDMNVYLDVNI